MLEAGRAVDLEEVTVRYAGARQAAVRDASAHVREGQVCALLGPNGAGKSTLLRAAAGLVRPIAGSVSVVGRDVKAYERRELARVVALVAQSETMPAGYRVRDVVAMGRAPHQGGWMRESAEDRAHVESAMARCDLERLADREAATLSGGEQKRVAVARALAQQPRVLLLDEPTAFLDVRHAIELRTLLGLVASRDGVACMIATHDLESTATLASSVVLMKDGRVVATGSAGEVMTPAKLRETFDVEVRAPGG